MKQKIEFKFLGMDFNVRGYISEYFDIKHLVKEEEGYVGFNQFFNQ